MNTNGSPAFTITCPKPQFDFDVITMGHGGGGGMTKQLLESGVFSLLDNEFLKTRHDGALIELNGPAAFSTDSFVISPTFFPGGNIGDLAVNGTINDLAMCGAIPKYLSLGLILEEGLKMDELWRIIVSIKSACEKAKVKIITGDTKVVEKGKGDKVFINTSGIGLIHPGANIDIKRVTPEDVLIISGHMAVHGITIMSLREGLTFETELQSDTRPLCNPVAQLLDKFGKDIHLLRDPTRGGVATVLNEIATQANVGIEINESKLPLLPQVNGACEMLGLDPLYVANEGIFTAFVAPEKALDCLGLMKSLPGGEYASIIGKVVSEHSGQVVMENSIGGRRVIPLLPGDQLPRIC